MSKVKILSQAKHEKELKSFIDKLSEIKIDYKLNFSEQQMISQSGETSLLFTICMMKVAMKISDKEIKDQLHLRAGFYKYLKTLLSDAIVELKDISYDYLASVCEINNISEDEAYDKYMRFFIQGQDYLRKNYYPEDSPYKDPEFIDKIIEMEDKILKIQNEGFATDNLEQEFEKSYKKVHLIAQKLPQLQQLFNNKQGDNFKIKKEDFENLIIVSATVLEEYDLLSNLLSCALEKYENAMTFCDELVSFIKDEDLVDKFNKNNSQDIFLDIKEIKSNKNTKKQKKPNKPEN